MTKKQKYWLDHYQAAKFSGKSLAVYAREHQLDAKCFHNWVYLLRKRGLIPGSEPTNSSGRFVPVKPVEVAVLHLHLRLQKLCCPTV
ncbi:IS66 family insertion sequence element accessory protein TnpA [Microbulbifer thermotolerans]|uniref:IS66 family insertion sequence element accessory protein TnpA n=1 Tax=Microbulbifer thermotolerans TaxID=252514 RepID=UPI0038B3E52B